MNEVINLVPSLDEILNEGEKYECRMVAIEKVKNEMFDEQQYEFRIEILHLDYDQVFFRYWSSRIYSKNSKLGKLVNAVFNDFPKKFDMDDLIGKHFNVIFEMQPSKNGQIYAKPKIFLPVKKKTTKKNGGK